MQIERKLGSRVDLWRINTNYTTEDSRNGFRELCRTDMYTKYSSEKDDDLQWRNCTLGREASENHLPDGTPEIFNKNITYVEIKVKHFVREEEDGRTEECVLSEIPETTAYVALLTFTFNEGSGVDSEPIFKLDRIMPEALGFFQDVIEVDAIYQFWPADFLSRKAPYQCLLDISSGASVETLKKNCSFSCYLTKRKGGPVPVVNTRTEL